MQQIYIADLHLSEHNPRLTRGFLDLLAHYQQQPTALYILGDWFNVWLSDHDPRAWLMPIVAALRAFTATGNPVYFLVGNRDFLLGESFLARFGGVLLNEPYRYQFDQLTLRLEHGDALCTDDAAYQRFKRIIRFAPIRWILTQLPFRLKLKLAHYARRKSMQRQQQMHYQPFDVNADAVAAALDGVDLLIHGHTHRPTQERHGAKMRIVLGDWHIKHDQGCAKILLISSRHQIELKDWLF